MDTYGNYRDPFYECTALEALSRTLHMTVVEYLRHQLALKEEIIKRRVAVLICVKRINNERIRRVEEEVKRREENAGQGSSSSSSSSSSSGGVVVVNRGGRVGEEFNGVLAESMITAIELWRDEIVMWL